MPKFLIISSDNSGLYTLLDIDVQESLKVKLHFRTSDSEEFLNSKDVDCFIFIPPADKDRLKLQKNIFISYRELLCLTRLSSDLDTNMKTLLTQIERDTFHPFTIKLGKDQINQICDSEVKSKLISALIYLLTFLAKVRTLSEDIRYRLAIVANYAGLPSALFLPPEERVISPFAETISAREIVDELSKFTKNDSQTSQVVTQKIVENTKDIFRILAERENSLDDFEYRAEQEEFSLLVESAFEKKKHLIIEAGTGVGKSIGYLIPCYHTAFDKGEPVIISTYTKFLQEQILNSDYVRLRELLSRPIPPPVILKGRENYVCLEKMRLKLFGDIESLSELIEELAHSAGKRQPNSQEERFQVLSLLNLTVRILVEFIGDFERLFLGFQEEDEFQASVRESLSCAFRGCLRERCPLFKNCFFYSQRELAEKSPLIILNHALLFSLYHLGLEATDALSNFVDKTRYFILDEAHSLEDAILSALRSEINSFNITDFTNSLLRLTDNKALLNRLSIPEENLTEEERNDKARLSAIRMKVPEFAEEIQHIHRELTHLSEILYLNFRDRDEEILQFEFTSHPEEEKNILKEQFFEVITNLNHILREFNYHLAFLYEKTLRVEGKELFEIDDNKYQIQLRETTNYLAELIEASSNLLIEETHIVRWLEVKPRKYEEGYFYRLCASPVTVGNVFSEFVITKDSVTMVSGTISIRGNFNFFKQALNLDALGSEKLLEAKLASPFNFKERALVILPIDVPEPDFLDKERYSKYLESLAITITESARCFEGNVLVLFNSYSDLNRTKELCYEELVDSGLTPIVQSRAVSRLSLAQDFRKSKGAVLLGTRSFWEGFDVKGEDLKCVIISKLPFPNIKDPMTNGKIRFLESEGIDSFLNFMLPTAIIRFTQGFGRLIRGKKDYGCVIVMDKRIMTKAYGRSFLDNLPKPRIEQVKQTEIMNKINDFLSGIRS